MTRYIVNSYSITQYDIMYLCTILKFIEWVRLKIYLHLMFLYTLEDIQQTEI